MGYLQARFVQDDIVIEQDIYINDARPPSFGFRPPHILLDTLADFQDLPGSLSGMYLNGHVQKFRLVLNPPGLGLVKP